MRISSFATVPLVIFALLAIVFSNVHFSPLLAGYPSGGVYSALASVCAGLVLGCALFAMSKRAEVLLPLVIVFPAVILLWLLEVPRKIRLLLLFGAALAGGLAIGRPAFAAETYAIDTKPMIDLIMPFFEPVILAAFTALLGIVAKLLKKYVGVELDEKHRESLAQIAASKLNQIAFEQVSAHAPTYYTRHQILQTVADYIVERGPQAVKHFGLTPKALEAYIAGNFRRELMNLESRSDVNTETGFNLRPASPYGRSGPMDPAPQGR
ncbi:hypothetical protein SAMN04515647_3741 [Cohaesibacter sp. ES.047]|uniref:hypothetical protein n=1 Tax=Cohaesibacter sp. ES.047 TaxID=1798205 RepID=UPI000BB6CAD2|nr:hypothetical protein [Cohaesibacter sp. ES.047]SNY93447.1 hypothetical protein SAMN04515647_3741 [Cohaesibacter sp. ES.047]